MPQMAPTCWLNLFLLLNLVLLIYMILVALFLIHPDRELMPGDNKSKLC